MKTYIADENEGKTKAYINPARLAEQIEKGKKRIEKKKAELKKKEEALDKAKAILKEKEREQARQLRDAAQKRRVKMAFELIGALQKFLASFQQPWIITDKIKEMGNAKDEVLQEFGINYRPPDA